MAKQTGLASKLYVGNDGRKWLGFTSGLAQYFIPSTATYTNPWTIFVAARINFVGSSSGVFTGVPGSQFHNTGLTISASGFRTAASLYGAGFTVGPWMSAPTTVYEIDMGNGAGDDTFTAINGANSSASAWDMTGTALGNFCINGENNLNAFIGEIVVYDRTLTGPEKTAVTNYLLAKWN
jgi:hypothetical protein